MSKSKQETIAGLELEDPKDEPVSSPKKVASKKKAYEPPNLAKAVKLKTPDFGDPNRPKTCLEVDFPIAPINALSNMEGNAGKPIYQMSKWWARRRSSIFRSMLIAAATQAPEEETQAAKLVWDTYYANHQKAGNFGHLRVLDPFMGGGTTLVEGARLGFELVGVDLNPVAWFVTKNELAGTDPGEIEALFDRIEAEVKPLVQPFYTTTCPRGHEGRWIDNETGKPSSIDPLDLPPEQRKQYRWEGPEITYTFWAKHGPCPAPGCGHRTPIFSDPIIAVKSLTTHMIPLTCPACGEEFQAELGETRMAPSAERVVLESEPSFTEMTQSSGQLFNDYNKGLADDKRERVVLLLEQVEDEPGLHCPACGSFAGQKVKQVLERHDNASRASDINKKAFGIKRYRVHMHLLIHPDWLAGSPGGGENDKALGGYAGAPPKATANWYRLRRERLRHIEVRGKNLPERIELVDGTVVSTTKGTVPAKSTFTCSACGRQEDILTAVKPTGNTPPVAVYALQCHCAQCEAEGYNYGGRYFSEVNEVALGSLLMAEHEWAERRNRDLADYWPREECQDAYMMRANGGVNDGWGYSHWWKMFNSRQLLVHTQLLRAIMDDNRSEAVKEQALGAFQQYLRNQNMFCFWDRGYDKLVPMMSNANFHPKSRVIENSVFPSLGRGNWQTCVSKVQEGVAWQADPWELFENPSNKGTKSLKVSTEDPVSSKADVYCGTATDLSFVEDSGFDLVITDPPFGNLLYYADLADFFHVWMRIALREWYKGKPEAKYFASVCTPHAMEAIENPVEHPDNRQEWEKTPIIYQEYLSTIQHILGDQTLQVNDPNPLFRPEPAAEFYRQTLTASWAEVGRYLKPGGILSFTFHHSEDKPWIDVLESLFNAGYVLACTFPIRSDETKGEGEFGSRKIEYDIIHVCRKRLEAPQPVSWSRMRRWVKKEARQLKEMLELSHGQELLEPDLLVILRGKALEFYSRHHGSVYTGEDELLSVRDALLGINQLLEDIISGDSENGRRRPPDVAEPATRFFLRMFQKQNEMERDELHKTLRGTGITSDDLEARGWITVSGTTVHTVPISARFDYFTKPGRNRKVLKADLDQAHFLIGAASPGSGTDITAELNRHTFTLKKSVDAILEWYSQTASSEQTRKAAKLALDLVEHWRSQPQAQPGPQQMSLFEKLEAEEAEE